MSQQSAFKTPEGEAAYLAAYDAAMKSWPVLYEEFDVPSRFGTTHVIASGPTTAPPLVLLHGFMATSTMWSPNIAAFSRDHRVYAVDVIGQPGKSIPAEPIRNVADFVSWLIAILDALHLDRVSLVGQSFGGWLALSYAIAAPQRLLKLVLLSPGGLLPMVRQFTVRGLLMVGWPTRLTVNSFMRWLGLTDRAFAPARDLMYLGMKHFRMPLETARIVPAAVSDEQLRTLQVPTLLLYGEADRRSPPEVVARDLHAKIPGSRLVVMPGVGHQCDMEAPDRFNAEVRSFLRSGHR